MEKPAPTQYKINDLLIRRWSPRGFSTQPVEAEKLKRLFEAARWSPSASNEQPWFFIVGIRPDQTWKYIFETLVDFNQKWCHTVPVLGLALGRTNLVKKKGKNQWFRYDVGQSLAHLTFQAMTDELWVHQMGGFDQKQAAEIFSIPENFEAISVFAIGYQGDYRELHPKLRKIEPDPRERKPFSDFIFSEKFGNTFNF